MHLDWREEAAKAERLERLFQKDGRTDPTHPMRGLFTGLMALAPSAQVTGTAAPQPAAAFSSSGSPEPGEQTEG